MEGAQAGKAVRDRGELEVQLDRLNTGNQQLTTIQKRLAVIRDNLYGKRAEIEKLNKPIGGTLGDPKAPEPNGAVAQLRQRIEYGQILRDNINELLNEIETFI